MIACWAVPAFAATVQGQVVAYPTGDPLPGIQILARDPQGASAAGASDADGRFFLDGVEPGAVRVQARVPDDVNRLGAYAGDVSAFCAAQVFELDPDGALSGVRIELPAGGTVAGVLRDGGGEPIAGTIRAQGVDTLNLGLSRAATADESGAFAVVGLASWVDADGGVVPGAYRLSGQLSGEPPFYAPGTWDSTEAALVPAVREQTTPVDLQRPVGADLSGVVRDADGEGMVAELAVLAAGFGVVWTGVSSPDGGWTATDVPGASLQVRVRAPGYAETWAGGGAGAAEAATFPGGEELQVGLVIPLAGRGAALTLAGVPDGSALITLSRPEGPSLRTWSAPVQGATVALDALPPGALEVGVQVPGFLPGRAALPDPAGSVPVAMVPAGSAEARVVARGNGRPVRGALVEAFVPGGGPVVGSARTDGDGRATLDDLPPGELVLRARWEPFCPGDGALTPVWSGAARSEPFAATLRGDDGTALPFALPPDRDRDGMDDVWELLWGLLPGVDDGARDPDGDGITSLEEYRAYTDPLHVERGIGCSVAESTPTCRRSGFTLLLVVLVGGFVRRHRDR